MGVGHLTRCLTLANYFFDNGYHCDFFCKNHPLNLNKLVIENGHKLYTLPLERNFIDCGIYSEWLGSTQIFDQKECLKLMTTKYDLIVVDHYGLDATWESGFNNSCSKILIIDDLANRKHHCDFILDATYQRNKKDYLNLLSKDAEFLLGSDYALLRGSFNEGRKKAIIKRSELKSINRIFIGFGGTDPKKLTLQSLEYLHRLNFQGEIDIAITSACEWINELHVYAKGMNGINIKIDEKDTAKLMLDSDVAFGSGGGMAWERCCLGLPTLMVSFIENQYLISKQLNNAGACRNIEINDFTVDEVRSFISNDPENIKNLVNMSNKAFSISDGLGANRVYASLDEYES